MPPCSESQCKLSKETSKQDAEGITLEIPVCFTAIYFVSFCGSSSEQLNFKAFPNILLHIL
jgi:hypothetical protein